MGSQSPLSPRQPSLTVELLPRSLKLRVVGTTAPLVRRIVFDQVETSAMQTDAKPYA